MDGGDCSRVLLTSLRVLVYSCRSALRCWFIGCGIFSIGKLDFVFISGVSYCRATYLMWRCGLVGFGFSGYGWVDEVGC